MFWRRTGNVLLSPHWVQGAPFGILKILQPGCGLATDGLHCIDRSLLADFRVSNWPAPKPAADWIKCGVFSLNCEAETKPGEDACDWPLNGSLNSPLTLRWRMKVRKCYVHLAQPVRLERPMDTGELVRRGIRGIFLTLSVRTTILDKGFSCRVRACAQFLLSSGNLLDFCPYFVRFFMRSSRCHCLIPSPV